MRSPEYEPQYEQMENGNNEYLNDPSLHAEYDRFADARMMARELYSLGMPELDKLGRGEHEAKLGLLVSLGTGLTLLYGGPPGGNKSVLARHGTKIIGDMGSDTTASVPPMMDITQQQLAGGTMTTEKSINGAKPERVTTFLDGIIKRKTTKIFADELPRLSPFGHNTLLAAAEERVLLTSEGEVPLDDLLLMVSTMNPADIRQGSFKPSNALAARQAIGVWLGKSLSRAEKKEALKERHQGKRLSDPKALVQISNIPKVKRIRELVHDDYALGINEEVSEELAEYSLNAEEYLDNPKWTGEEVWRLDMHAHTTAKALTAFEGKHMLESKHVRLGVKYALVGRIATLGSGDANHVAEQIDCAVNDVLGNKKA